jgi:hypothetical protein
MQNEKKKWATEHGYGQEANADYSHHLPEVPPK